MVIWIIGLSGSGKTTIGSKIYSLMRYKYPNTVFLDGDMVRSICDHDLGHTIEGRRINSDRVSRLCLELDKQGSHVVCSILSIFHDAQEWNRENYSEYKEIYLDVTMETLLKRDSKKLYQNAIDKIEQNVVGIDIAFNPPISPNVIINNDIDIHDFTIIAKQALRDIGIDVGPLYIYSDRNLLAEPEKYEYSDFLGETFLDGYHDKRIAAIDNLQARISIVQEIYGASFPVHPWVELFDLPSKASGIFCKELNWVNYDRPRSDASMLNTKEEMTRIINSWCGTSGGIDNYEYSTIFALIRRFEVSKKIYANYTFPEIRGIGNDTNDIVNYSLFSIVLNLMSAHLDIARSLIMLNAILKLNDILTSIDDGILSPANLYLVLTSLRMELKNIDIVENGISQ